VFRRMVCLLLSCALLSLVGCNGLLPQPAPGTLSPQPTRQDVTPTSKLSPGETASPQGTVETPRKLTLWVPPQFDPSANNPAAVLLRGHLQEFSQQHANIQVEVRVKAAAGPGGLLDALAATNSAAPAALPDLVALPRPDLEAAALKGLIYPFDGQTRLPDDPDWYNYARQLGILQGSSFGLPFAGDALVLLYRSSQAAEQPKDWNTLLSQPGVMAFPAADPQALFSLALYQSAGGQIEDAQRRPILTANSLVTVLKLYESGVKSGKFPPWLAQSETDVQAWQAYREQQAAWVVTWASHYLAEVLPDTSLMPLMSLGDKPSTLATGWLWTLATPRPERQEMAVSLAEFLVKSDFLADWTVAAGFLPPRPTALAGWKDQVLVGTLSQIELSAQARPTNDLTSSLGPLLKDASIMVIKGQSDPVQAAQTAAARLKGP
jgi:multiple sugar transport system substrate-binding protein